MAQGWGTRKSNTNDNGEGNFKDAGETHQKAMRRAGASDTKGKGKNAGGTPALRRQNQRNRRQHTLKHKEKPYSCERREDGATSCLISRVRLYGLLRARGAAG